VLTLATKALTVCGPDLGEVYDLSGCCAIASTRLVDHDFFAATLLPWCNARQSSVWDRFSLSARPLNFLHALFVGGIWGLQGLRGYEQFTPYCYGNAIERDRCVSHLAVLQQYRPRAIDVLARGDALPGALADYLRGAGGGIFSL
jgi:hypothetical protein